MEIDLVATPRDQTKLQIALTSPPIGFAVDLPEGIEATKYLTILASQVSKDIEAMIASVDQISLASVTLSKGDFAIFGEMMSERIAKIEQRLEHLTATIDVVNGKLDRILEASANAKTVNTVILDKFVEYDKKLDKKPSKDEVEKLISQGANKQIVWTVGILVVLAGLAMKFLH